MGVGVIWALMVVSDRDPAHTSLAKEGVYGTGQLQGLGPQVH